MHQKGHCFIYCGEGKGKTTQAIGKGIRAIGEELTVIMIQFLDYNKNKEFIMLESLEPEFKMFRFEKERDNVDYLDDADKKEIRSEVSNAVNFSKKILETNECDVLILDGILDAISEGYASKDDVVEIIKKRSGSMDLVITGEEEIEEICELADAVCKITTVKKLKEDE